MTTTLRRGEQLALELPVCVLPGCRNIVTTPGQPCPDCIQAFGPYLQAADGPAPTPQAIQACDDTVREALYARHAVTLTAGQPAEGSVPERRRNQTCWLCEQRRTCTRTQQGWECDTCQEIP